MTTQRQWSSRAPTWTWLMWDGTLAKTCWPMLALATAWGSRACIHNQPVSHELNAAFRPPDFDVILVHIHRLVCAFISPLLMPAEPLS